MRSSVLVGIDEAGRGPLAGPVAVGAFAVGAGFDMRQLFGIRDSKTLSAKQREKWYGNLTRMEGVRWSVAMTSNTVIDRIGIVPSVGRALGRALAKVVDDPSITKVLLDGGLKAPAEYTDQQTIIHGDTTEPLIAAAAILAKVTRDRYMVHQAKKFPLYGFDQHMGYGTRQHREAIVTHGPCRLHRETFCENILKREKEVVKSKKKRDTSKNTL